MRSRRARRRYGFGRRESNEGESASRVHRPGAPRSRRPRDRPVGRAQVVVEDADAGGAGVGLAGELAVGFSHRTTTARPRQVGDHLALHLRGRHDAGLHDVVARGVRALGEHVEQRVADADVVVARVATKIGARLVRRRVSATTRRSAPASVRVGCTPSATAPGTVGERGRVQQVPDAALDARAARSARAPRRGRPRSRARLARRGERRERARARPTAGQVELVRAPEQIASRRATSGTSASASRGGREGAHTASAAARRAPAGRTPRGACSGPGRRRSRRRERQALQVLDAEEADVSSSRSPGAARRNGHHERAARPRRRRRRERLARARSATAERPGEPISGRKTAASPRARPPPPGCATRSAPSDERQRDGFGPGVERPRHRRGGRASQASSARRPGVAAARRVGEQPPTARRARRARCATSAATARTPLTARRAGGLARAVVPPEVAVGQLPVGDPLAAAWSISPSSCGPISRRIVKAASAAPSTRGQSPRVSLRARPAGARPRAARGTAAAGTTSSIGDDCSRPRSAHIAGSSGAAACRPRRNARAARRRARRHSHASLAVGDGRRASAAGTRARRAAACCARPSARPAARARRTSRRPRGARRAGSYAQRQPASRSRSPRSTSSR